MKKTINTIVLIAVIGMFALVLGACSTKKECNTQCCKTEVCKQNCINSGCCKEGKTCDITNHQACKHKCCDTTKKECPTDGEKSCCKTS